MHNLINIVLVAETPKIWLIYGRFWPSRFFLPCFWPGPGLAAEKTHLRTVFAGQLAVWIKNLWPSYGGPQIESLVIMLQYP